MLVSRAGCKRAIARDSLFILLALPLLTPLSTSYALALMVFGASNAVPVVFSAAGNQQTMPVNLAISSMTTVGYAGILVGPALIGFIPQWYSLTTAFSTITILLLAVAASARLITR